MLYTQLGLQVIPITLIGLLASVLGAWIWPAPDNGETLILRVLLLLLVFLGLIALKRRVNWNVGLLIMFGFLAGSFTGLIQSGSGVENWLWALGIAITIQSISLLTSRAIRIRWNDLGVGLWLLAWAYLLGWAGLMLLDLDVAFRRVWAGFGLVLFACMSAVWFSNYPHVKDQLSGTSLGIDLYLLTINLSLAVRILWFDV